MNITAAPPAGHQAVAGHWSSSGRRPATDTVVVENHAGEALAPAPVVVPPAVAPAALPRSGSVLPSLGNTIPSATEATVSGLSGDVHRTTPPVNSGSAIYGRGGTASVEPPERQREPARSRSSSRAASRGVPLQAKVIVVKPGGVM